MRSQPPPTRSLCGGEAQREAAIGYDSLRGQVAGRRAAYHARDCGDLVQRRDALQRGAPRGERPAQAIEKRTRLTKYLPSIFQLA